MHDLTGRVFDRLTVLEPVRIRRESGRSVLKWKCKCSCGNERLVVTDDLLNGRHKSCGCLRKEMATTHGMSRSKEYRAYIDMISRCYKEPSVSFPYYGAKGIKVCDRWLESFENFYEDMGDCPDGLSLERKDFTSNYCPENCEWADWFRQMANRGLQSNNTSGRTGVYLLSNGLWCSQIKFKNETLTLGSFENFEEACKVREEAELKYFGFIKEFDDSKSNICNTK